MCRPTRTVARSRQILWPTLFAVPALLHAAAARADGVVDLLPNVSVDADRLADAYIDAETPGVVLLPLTAVSEPHAVQWIESARASIPMRWTATDPEGDPIRVALFIDRDQMVDKGTRPLGGYQNLIGASGQAQII
jgi:hypothetical protein